MNIVLGTKAHNLILSTATPMFLTQKYKPLVFPLFGYVHIFHPFFKKLLRTQQVEFVIEVGFCFWYK